MAKKNKRVDLDVRPKGPWFSNYDYGGPENGDETSPGTGFFQNMKKYKSVTDFLDKKRKSRKKAMSKLSLEMLCKESGVIDLTKKLEEKQKTDEEKGFAEQLQNSPKQEIENTNPLDDLQKQRDKKNISTLKEDIGSWSHRFSDVRKDDLGFYILLSDNPASSKMQVGDLLSDASLNHTPYWSVSNIEKDAIRLTPISPNPFLTGKGAGGAKLTNYDVSVFSGEYEKKRLAALQEKLESGTATLDDVIYLLEGTVPVEMGPNGAQGGWYSPSDRRANRGGRKGMKEEQIMLSDAKQLKQWGFAVPVKALTGEMDIYDWEKWISGNGSSDLTYIPQNLEKYVDFHRKMTEKGKYRYTEDSLQDLKKRLSEETISQYWEVVLEDAIALNDEEFKQKYPYYTKNIPELVSMMNGHLDRLKKEKEKFKNYFVEGEEETEESVLKSVFHPERRVSIRNLVKLIEMSKEEPKYLNYLKDVIRLGGAPDAMANEKIINHFDLMDDVEGLKLSAEHLNHYENIRYSLNYLINQNEIDFVKKKLEEVNDLSVLNSVLGNLFSKFSRPKNLAELDWIIDFAKRNNLYSVIEESIPSKDFTSYAADELISLIARVYEARYGHFPRTELEDLKEPFAEYQEWSKLYKKYKSEKK